VLSACCAACCFLQLEATNSSQASTLAHLRVQLQQSEGQTHEARQMLAAKAAAYTLLMQEKADLAVQSIQVSRACAALVLIRSCGGKFGS
jgi:hypothetical protein